MSDFTVKDPFSRRKVCVVSVDVVGYSRMIGHSATATVELMRLLRGYIQAHSDSQRGTIFGGSGDSYLLEFSAISNGVIFALNLQYSLKHRNEVSTEQADLTVRVGLDYGEVIDDEGELHGDCINSAVRLQEAAPSGGILASWQIYQAQSQSTELRFDPLGQLHFKNIASAISVYLVQRQDESLALSTTDSLHPAVLSELSGIERGLPIAVLPFQNADKDPEMEHVCTGIREELVLFISRSKLLPVIDSNLNSVISAEGIDALAIGRKLNVRYLILGSVTRLDNGYGVTARLVDTKLANVVWSEKYLASPDKMYQTLDDIVLRIAGTIDAQIARHEESLARSKRVSRTSVTDLIWRGRWHMNRLTREDSLAAEKLFERALEADSNHPEALIQLGYLKWIESWVGRKTEPEVEQITRLAYRAMQASDGDARGHFLVGATNIMLRDIEVAKLHLEEAIHLNPSLAQAYAQLGSCYMLSGKPEEAVPLLELSLRLNPLDYYVFYVLGELAASHCMLGDWENSIQSARKSMSYRPFYWHARMSEINASARSGNMMEARRALNALLARRPDFARNYIEWLPFIDRNWVDYFYQGIELTQRWTKQAD